MTSNDDDALLRLNLSNRYEERVLSLASSDHAPIPCVVITGFLGSGKTSLVGHLLKNRGSLRLAVLVNEVGAVDVDSMLLNAKQGNSAVGVPHSSDLDLSGGCLCCVRNDELHKALSRIQGGNSSATTSISTDSDPENPSGRGEVGGGGAGGGGGGGRPDYLIIETSGVADPETLAYTLASSGFRLDAVVTLLDAEAGPGVLEDQEVARRQLGAADLVIINKCDLVGLGQVADLEDRVREWVPGVRTVRARYGQVPLPVVLDVVPSSLGGSSEGGQSGIPGSRGGGSRGDGGGGGGGGWEVGFLSHEARPVSAVMSYVVGAAAGAAAAATAGATGAGMDEVGGGLVPSLARRRTPRVEDIMHNGHQRPMKQQRGGGAGHSDNQDHSHDQGHGDAGHCAEEAEGGGHQRPPSDNASLPPSHLNHHHGHHHVHGHLHDAFYTRSATLEESPISLHDLQDFITRHLIMCPGLYRAKRAVWVQERRTHRFVLHFSGARRVECCMESSPWDSPPKTQLVFIGSDPNKLDQLVETLSSLHQQPSLSVSTAASPPFSGFGGGQDGEEEGAIGHVASRQQQQQQQFITDVSATVASDPRLKVVDLQISSSVSPIGTGSLRPLGTDSATTGDHAQPVISSSSSSPTVAAPPRLLLEFSSIAMPLHGVSGPEVNASIMTRVNHAAAAATTAAAAVAGQGQDSAAAAAAASVGPGGGPEGRGIFLFGTKALGSISASTGVHKGDGIASLLLALPPKSEPGPSSAGEHGETCASDHGEVHPPALSSWQEVWVAVKERAAPVLRKAYQHTNCKCDVMVPSAR